jgi:hypothetical protein
LDSSIIQGPFSVAPCQTLVSRFATFYIAVRRLLASLPHAHAGEEGTTCWSTCQILPLPISRYRFKFQSTFLWDSIKPNKQLLLSILATIAAKPHLLVDGVHVRAVGLRQQHQRGRAVVRRSQVQRRAAQQPGGGTVGEGDGERERQWDRDAVRERR